MRKIEGKRALVTGAASGIGRAIALRLAERGAHLLLVDRDAAGLETTVRQCLVHGIEAEGRVCDVVDRQAVSKITAEAMRRWAGVDILVNNVGLSYRGQTHEMPAEEWDYILQVNLHSHMQFTRELLPGLIARHDSHIVNVCSVLGLVGLPRVAVYSAAKFAMKGFSESLRAEYGRVGLGVTCLCPGFVETNLFKNSHTATPQQKVKRPPKVICTTADRVAKAAVSAIRHDRDVVLVEWFARFLHLWKRFSPGTMDLALRWGWWRRTRVARSKVEALGPNRTAAIREWIRLQENKLEVERRAA